MKNHLFIAIMLMTSSIYATHYRPATVGTTDSEGLSFITTGAPAGVPQASSQVWLNNDLSAASASGLANEVQLAIQKGANVNSINLIGWTPLINAIEHIHLEIVKILIQHQADISKPDTNGKTPIEHVQQRIQDRQKYLKEAFARKNPNKEEISKLKAQIEDLYKIGHLVSPAAPAAPPAPWPTYSLTAGATPQSEQAEAKAESAASSFAEATADKAGNSSSASSSLNASETAPA